MKLTKILLSILLIILFIVPQSIVNATTSKNLTSTVNFSTWLWNTNEIVNNSDRIINFLIKNKIKTLYLQIDYNLDFTQYNNFISKAYNNNIKVEALDGSPAWVSSNGAVLQNAFFDWLSSYQKASPINAQFKGVHIDVEPYGNSDYINNPNEVITRYQDFILKSKKLCSQLNLPLGVDIPFWFNEIQYNTVYGSGNLAEWIFQNVKIVSIMAYRNVASGDNGINMITEAEMNLAKKYNVKASIAVETSKLENDTYLTFYDQGQIYMFKELNTVYQKYKTYSSFTGFSIHSLDSWIIMKA